MRFPAVVLVACCALAGTSGVTLVAVQPVRPAVGKPSPARPTTRPRVKPPARRPPPPSSRATRPQRLTDADYISALHRPALESVAVRRLDAGSRKLNTEGWMQARTWTHPTQGVKYTVLQAGGSERVLEKVLRPVLDAEVEHSSQSVARLSALTADNYTFKVERQAGGVYVYLAARRADPRLINGVAMFSSSGVLQRIEGRLADRPSFWVKSVTIVREYEQVAGVTMPRSVESVADVRLAGLSRFLMTYHYESVNGRALRGALASASTRRFSLEPSSQILALYLRGT